MTTQTITIMRGLLMLVAVLFETGAIQTGVEGGGRKVAATCVVILGMWAAGDKTAQVLKDAAQQQIEAIQGFVSVPGRDNNVLPNSQAAWIAFAAKALIAVLTALAS